MISEVIIVVICQHFHLSREELLSKARPHHIAWPRQIGMALLYESENLTQQQVADVFGRGDHATVNFAIKRVKDECENPNTAKEIEGLRKMIGV